MSFSLREKCPNTEFFLVRIYPHSNWIRRDTELSAFSPNAGKYRPEKTPYWDIFMQCLFYICKIDLIVKNVHLKVSKKLSGKHLCQGLLFKKRLWRRCFPVNFVKFLRTPISTNFSGGCFCLLNNLKVHNWNLSKKVY